MDNFDLKKFLIENKLTKLSEETEEDFTVDAPKEWDRKTPYLPLSKKEVEILKTKGKVTKTFSGAGLAHKVDQKTLNNYININDVSYTDWSTGQRVIAPCTVEYEPITGILDVTVYNN